MDDLKIQLNSILSTSDQTKQNLLSTLIESNELASVMQGLVEIKSQSDLIQQNMALRRYLLF